MYLNREKCVNAFPRSTDMIQVLNELPSDKRHIKVPQDTLLCPTHVNNKIKLVFENILFRCVTRPDLSVVPLINPFLKESCIYVWFWSVLLIRRNESLLAIYLFAIYISYIKGTRNMFVCKWHLPLSIHISEIKANVNKMKSHYALRCILLWALWKDISLHIYQIILTSSFAICIFSNIFRSPEHEVLKWAFVIFQCPASVVRRPSVRPCVRQQFL